MDLHDEIYGPDADADENQDVNLNDENDLETDLEIENFSQPSAPQTNPEPPAAANSKKRGRKAKEKVPPFTWKDDLVYFMIDKWQEETVLYNVNEKDYHDKLKRNGAIQRIVNKIAENFKNSPNPNAQQVLDKMNTLRSYFNTQKHKVQ